MAFYGSDLPEQARGIPMADSISEQLDRIEAAVKTQPAPAPDARIDALQLEVAAVKVIVSALQARLGTH